MARSHIIGLLLGLITLLVYLPVIHCGFLTFDDNGYITDNSIVRNGLTWAGIKWAFTADVAGNWHPLTMLSHMLDCELFGLNAGMQHLVNVLFHTANAVLLLVLLWRMTGMLGPSALVAALFAWHPLHVESVAWISERKDVLSTFFELLALLAYTRYVKEKQCGSFWLALFLFALGLLAKPMIVTLPFVMLLLDFWPLRRISDFQFSSLWRLVLEKWPFFFLTAIFCVVTFLAQSQPNADAVVSLGQISLPYRFANALISYDRYLLKIFWPTDLSIIYPLLENSVWMQVAVIASITTLVIVSWLVWRLRQQFPYLFVGWLWFLGTLLPVIGLVQVGIQAMADRYTYIPSVGIFIAIAFGIRNLISRFQIGFTSSAIAGGLILTSCLTLTERQLSYWRNSETLFKHAIAVTKNNYTAHLNVAIAIAGQRRRDEALVEYHEALFIEPELQLAHDDLAALLSEMGRPHEALIQLQQAVNLDPRDRLGRLNYGILEAKVGHLSEAINQFTQSAQLDPKNPKPFFEMGRALLQQGRDDEAISNFRKALRLDPNNFEMLIYLSRVLASDQKEKIRSGSIALAMAAEANDLTHETQPIAFDAMAMAYAEIGQFSEAQKAEEYAIKLATAYNQNAYTAEMKQRLELYKKNQPYRQTFTKTPANVSRENRPEK